MINHPHRRVDLDGGINFRDLGGYQSCDGRRVRWNKIYRSGHLGNLTDADIRKLESLSLTHIHDFRRKKERQRTPNRSLKATVTDDYEIHVGSLSKFWEFLNNGALNAETAHELVSASYADSIHHVAPGFRRLFLSLLDNAENATLFHCAAGKDRTGLAAALVLAALKVDRDTIVQDYLLTLQFFDHTELLTIVEDHLRDANVSYWERSWLMPYVSVHEDNIARFFTSIESHFGDVPEYLHSALGLEYGQLEDFRAAYLE